MASSKDSRFEFMQALTAEFTGVAEDSLREIEAIIEDLRAGRQSTENGLLNVSRLTHSLKGQGATFGYPNVSLVAHLAEDYLDAMGHHADFKALLLFYDRMAEIVNGQLPRDGKEELVLINLPTSTTFELDDITVAKVNTILVMPSGIQRILVRRELQACGYPPVVIENASQALEYIYRVRPDLVISSLVLSGISGLELALALKAIPATRDIPICLLTSLSETTGALSDLPNNVPVVRKGTHFGDDLADALSRLGIT